MDRRNFFQRSAWVTTGAMVGCARPDVAQQQSKTPFPVPATYIPVADANGIFPVRRIYCIGRNYAAHARKTGSDSTREPPLLFQKPTDAIQYVAAGTVPDHPYPTLTKTYHYEAELVAALGKGGHNIALDKALEYVYGQALRLTMTRRDLQRAMGDQKKPEKAGNNRPEFRQVRSDRHCSQAGADQSLYPGRHLAQSQWTDQAKCQPEPDDRGCGRTNSQTVGVVRAIPRQQHQLGHARERRAFGGLRCHRNTHQWSAQPQREDHSATNRSPTLTIRTSPALS